MNMPIAAVPKSRTHPMLIIAGAAVVLVSLTGTAALMGWLPSSNGAVNADATALAQPVTPAAAAGQVASHAAPLHAAAAPPAYHHARTEPMRRTPVLVCQNCGTVESIREISTRGNSNGLGAAGGAVVGGLLGNQVGGGHGKQAMTVVGAIGGAFAGNQIEKQARATLSYETTVRMDNGSSRTIGQSTQPVWRDGDHVKVVDGVVRMNG